MLMQKGINFSFCIQMRHQLFLPILAVFALAWFGCVLFHFVLVTLFILGLGFCLFQQSLLISPDILFAQRDVFYFLVYTHF